MAWIESHQTLLTHRKTIALRVALGVSQNETIGLLHRLWWWSLDNAPDGKIGSLGDAVIAEVCGWGGDPAALVAALKKAGFVEEDGDIHEWDEYSGRLINDRERDKERKRLQRARTDVARLQELHALSGGCPADVQRTNLGRQSDVHHASRGIPRVPNTTQPNRTVISTSLSHSCTPVAVEPPTERETQDAVDRPPAPNGDSISDFERFWSSYPAKRARGDAEHAWVEVGAVHHTEAILVAIEEQKHSDDWQRDRGRWIPMPARWLRDRRWEDQPADTRPDHSKGF